MQIFVNVALIVNVGEGVMDDREVESDRRDEQHNTQADGLLVPRRLQLINLFEGRRSYRSHRCAL